MKNSLKWIFTIFLIIAISLNGCREFDGSIETRTKCIPMEIACSYCSGSSFLVNISTDKVITYVIRITYKGDKLFTSTRRIELFPGEEKRLGNNYDYRKVQRGGKCFGEKIFEQHYEYKIVGQVVTKHSK